MADKCNIYFLIVVLFLKNVDNYNIPEIDKDYDIKSHLEKPTVKKYCANRDVACRSNNSAVCALRYENGSSVYKKFMNHCYLFLSNMCDSPGEEFHILTAGACEDYLALRRNDEDTEHVKIDEDNEETTEPVETTSVEIENISTETSDSDNQILRNKVTTAKTVMTTQITKRVTMSETFDNRPCPLSCPNIYSPVCVNVNRGYGKYFKMFTFVNHCMSTLYYCKNPEEFKQPPDEEYEDDPGAYVMASPLGWSFCGASRYLQFARFAEVTSSMGHYGWLAGNYRFSHIMEPHQRQALGLT